MNKAISVLLALALSISAIAADLTTYRCSYVRYADGSTIKSLEKPFELIFVTDDQGKATLVGNRGSFEVMGFWNKAQDGVTFIEVTTVGNVMTTVVDTQGASVHSRHTLMAGAVVPSQYYGTCNLQ